MRHTTTKQKLFVALFIALFIAAQLLVEFFAGTAKGPATLLVVMLFLLFACFGPLPGLKKD